MASYLFHQNMKTFGGAQPARITAYRAAFQQIRIDLGHGNRFLAAGFTEIANNQMAAQAFRGDHGLCAQLGVRYHSTILCGSTVLGRKEYLVVGFHQDVQIEAIGRVFVESTTRGAQSFLDVSPGPLNPGWAANLPPRASGDFRGVVVARIRFQEVPSVVGFLHNVYSLDPQRSLFAGQIPNIMGKLRAWAGLGVRVYVGGDYNVLPPPPGGTRGTARTGFAYAQALGDPGYYDATTWGRNLYDYWFTSHERIDGLPFPSANRETMDGAANSGNPKSDHMAIMLRID